MIRILSLFGSAMSGFPVTENCETCVTPLPKAPPEDGEVEIKLSVRGIVWIKGHAEQTLLTRCIGQPGHGKKRGRVERAGEEIQNSNIPVLLHDK